MWAKKIWGQSTINYKVVETEDKFLQKVILVIKRKTSRRSPVEIIKGIALVRDGFLVKVIAQKNHAITHAVYGIGYKRKIGAKNIGSMWKKHSVPPAIRSLILKHSGNRLLRGVLTYKGIAAVFENSDITRRVMEALYDPNRFILNSYSALYKDREKIERIKRFLANFSSVDKRIDHFLYVHINDSMYALERLEASMSKAFGELNSNRAKKLYEQIDWSASPVEFHDQVNHFYQMLISPDEYESFVYSEKAISAVKKANEVLSGIEDTRSIKLKLAENQSELSAWGRKLSHCIGSYGRRAMEGAVNDSLLLMGAYFDGEEYPRYTAEMYADRNGKWSFRQFRGRFNVSIDDELGLFIKGALNMPTLKSEPQELLVTSN